MGAAPRTDLKPPLPSARTLFRRLRPRGRSGLPAATAPLDNPPLDPFQQLGIQMREAREARGLGLRQLAQETRISTPVLEALEKGWRERLPEAAYLRTMLPLLERHLQMPPGSLDAALPKDRRGPAGPRREPLLRRFTPGSIDVFTSWQGTLLYSLLILSLIYGLNLQQQRLAAGGMLSVAPLPLGSAPDADAPPAGGAEVRLLAAFPDLRPLAHAASGQAMARLRTEGSGEYSDLSLGVLQLTLAAPTRVEVRSQRGGNSRLAAVQGTLAMPVLPPFRLVLTPAPQKGAVRWNGRLLSSGPDGEFRYPSLPFPMPPVTDRGSPGPVRP